MGRPAKIQPPTTAEKKKSLVPLPFSRGPKLPSRPPGPPNIDLPSAHPGKVSKCLQRAVLRRVFPIWIAVNTRGRFKPHFGARWRWRRGALFIHWMMHTRELRARANHDPSNYYYHGEALRIADFATSQKLTKREEPRYLEGIIAPPGNAMVGEVLTADGGITRSGVDQLEDKEFVWPFLDALAPGTKLFTELMIAKQYEKPWVEHFYGEDIPAPRLEVSGHVEPTFALVYTRYMKQLGRGGPGTKLGKWLDAWLERADKEEKRLEA